ncbi:MAG: argininosuccinate lyase, partial [Clostridia bacterium]|nr:argininosuccinate lyase [Clostridia bacterium]
MKLWGGRFKGEMDKQAQDFQSSLRFDQRLWRYDIQGSIAHAEMLGRQGVISSKDAADIIAGLKSIAQALEKGELALPGEAEDVHTAVEALLTERIGSTGGKLHTGRSRNDQVALDLRMYVRDEIGHLANLLM